MCIYFEVHASSVRIIRVLVRYPFSISDFIIRLRSSDDDDVVLDLRDHANLVMSRGTPALPCATGSPATARPRHALPTQQPSMASAKERAPKPDAASGGRGKIALPKTARSLPEMGRRRKKTADCFSLTRCQYSVGRTINTVLWYCCSTWRVGWLVGGWVRGWAGDWVGGWARGRVAIGG